MTLERVNARLETNPLGGTDRTGLRGSAGLWNVCMGSTTAVKRGCVNVRLPCYCGNTAKVRPVPGGDLPA
jgi:hypothetical protein